MHEIPGTTLMTQSLISDKFFMGLELVQVNTAYERTSKFHGKGIEK